MQTNILEPIAQPSAVLTMQQVQILPPFRACFHCGRETWVWTDRPALWDRPNWQCLTCYPHTIPATPPYIGQGQDAPNSANMPNVPNEHEGAKRTETRKGPGHFLRRCHARPGHNRQGPGRQFCAWL